ncbi:hypothetical protein SERLA73DRAFT_70028 [Serpula lacrymans var. lacrymans S7.3]|uniref:Uncharacterized protein n=1 Tax=Serpula lacrymans var. lacrymans (strain S7.3) TaxID=936435 RepID=F8PLP5_SERL3|nr:hypothetical protein SERLA73DRAFT_70028 [Serpula lacrymans var. lacrymans S7.3]
MSRNNNPDVEEQLRMPEVVDDYTVSIAECQTHRLNRQLLKQFRDDLPQPLPAVPSSTIDATYGLERPHAPALSMLSHAQSLPRIDQPLPYNRFPTHNPKENMTPDNSPDSNNT